MKIRLDKTVPDIPSGQDSGKAHVECSPPVINSCRKNCKCKKCRPIIKTYTIPSDRGEQGFTPYVGENENWWINGVDTGFVSRGPRGLEGQTGDKQINLYSKNMSSINPPSLEQVPEPNGWTKEPVQLYDGECMWLTSGVLNFDGSELISQWSLPVIYLVSDKYISIYKDSDYIKNNIVSYNSFLYKLMSDINNRNVSPDKSLQWQIYPKGTSSRIGRFITPNFGHRVGVFEYEKQGNVAKLLTDLNPYKAETNASFVTLAVYVDNINGSPTNDGLSWATAKSRFDHALAMNPDIIFIKSSILQGNSQFANGFTVNKDLSIIGVGGQVTAGTPQRGSYSKEPGYNNVYRRSTENQGTTQRVFDMVSRDQYFSPKIYQKLTDVSNLDSTEGSFFREPTGGVLIHPFNNRELSSNDTTILMETLGAGIDIVFNGNYKLYMENISFVGNQYFVLKGNGSEYSKSVFYNKNCKWIGMKRNGLGVTDIGLCISEKTEITHSTRDGFNYHYGMDMFGGQTNMSPHFIEIDVLSTGNGYQRTDLNNQASTSHEDCIGFRINGIYAGQRDGGNIVDVGGTKCYMVNPTSFGSSIVGMYLSSSGGGTTGNKAIWWIDGGIVYNNDTEPNAGTGDISVAGSFAQLHVIDEYTEKQIFINTNVSIADRSML